jgi:hypothetical protein
MHRQNIEHMRTSGSSPDHMDVVIVSTSSCSQAKYWQKRLETTRGLVCHTDAIILVVNEEWSGGAGNGLGTLYAYQQARDLGRRLHGCDILEMQKKGASVALYHTAGKGTRLAPLPGSEAGNKSAVKLPSLLLEGHDPTWLTILEAVIRQTSLYGPSRSKRLSVFWGDQLFIPDHDPTYVPKHHVDLLGRVGATPSADQWEQQQMDRYGLIAMDSEGHGKQIEKISHTKFQSLIETNVLNHDGGLATSLGSFSVSLQLLKALKEEFRFELASRSGHLNTDHHFWMPMTLDWEVYRDVYPAAKKGYYHRMSQFKSAFQSKHPEPLLGVVDIGANAYWWDYGSVGSYFENNMRLLDRDDEAAAMRNFFGVSDPIDGSLIIACDIDKTTSKGSILAGIHAETVSAEGSLLFNCTAPHIQAANSLAYNCVESHELALGSGQVRADAFLPADKRHIKLETECTRDGGKDWTVKVGGNPVTYEELHSLSTGIDLEAHSVEWSKLRRSVRQRSSLD